MLVLWEKRYPHSGEVAELLRYKPGAQGGHLATMQGQVKRNETDEF